LTETKIREGTEYIVQQCRPVPEMLSQSAYVKVAKSNSSEMAELAHLYGLLPGISWLDYLPNMTH